MKGFLKGLITFFILSAVLVAVGTGYYVYQSIEKEYVYEIPEIVTDLGDGSFVQIQFSAITTDKHTYDELEKREFQITNVIIGELATQNKEGLGVGLEELEGNLKSKINETVESEGINALLTTNKVVQGI